MQVAAEALYVHFLVAYMSGAAKRAVIEPVLGVAVIAIEAAGLLTRAGHEVDIWRLARQLHRGLLDVLLVARALGDLAADPTGIFLVTDDARLDCGRLDPLSNTES